MRRIPRPPRVPRAFETVVLGALLLFAAANREGLFDAMDGAMTWDGVPGGTAGSIELSLTGWWPGGWWDTAPAKDTIRLGVCPVDDDALVDL